MSQAVKSFTSCKLSFVMLPFIACLLLATSAGAQTTVTGAVEGQVLDNAGNGIPNVRVQIVDTESQVPYESKTDANGRYSRQQLSPGLYVVNIELPAGFTSSDPNRSVRVFITKTRSVAPPITLTPAPPPTPVVAEATPVTPAEPKEQPLGARPASILSPSPGPSPVIEEEDISIDINRTDASRGGSYPEKEVSTLPLGSVTLTRSFDELALLLPGVATPPQTQGDVAGPGVGAGVGSAGQFAVNGLRSRANNFTVDGSDNNDEDIGVRRQGFLTLVPQSIESIQEYQVITLLAPAQYGRNFGAQVNAVSKSGGNLYHGTFFGFFNSSQLNARNFFDSVGRNTTTPLQANGQNVILRTLNASGVQSEPDQAIPIRYSSGDKESSTLAQAGLVFSGPLVKTDPTNEKSRALFLFFSVEGLLLNATKEANFAVPTLAQRGIFNSGVTGVFFDPFFDPGDPRRNVSGVTQSRRGAGVLSLFPFPNNPTGIYGANTLTRTLPASGFGKIISGKTNGNFYVRGRRQDITARYNFTDDARTVPVTGGGLFSSVRPRIRTHNFSTFLNSEITEKISNEARASYGRTRLVFDDVPDREFLIPSGLGITGQDARFLLNATYLADITRPSVAGQPNTGPVTFARLPQDPFRMTSENATGAVGQVKVGGLSPLGVDVFNFPQSRVNNTYQLADTLNVNYGRHRFAFGEDIRRIELNSDLPRNSRPILEYTGQVGSDQTFFGLPITPTDFVAAGAPTGARQVLNTSSGDSTIHLRYYEYNFFGQDEWRIRPNLSLSYGLRYEYNSPPRESDRRIESIFTGTAATSSLPALRSFFNGRTKIYDPERTNFAPRLGIAYARRLFKSDRETVFRAGYGMYYDQIIGAVVSQSRNLFPTFLTLNTGGGLGQINGNGSLDFASPATIGFCRARDAGGNCLPGRFDPLIRPGTLNQINPNVSFAEFLSLGFTFFDAGGFGLTLPTRRLKTPVAQHYSFTVEQPLGKSMVLSVAYVGTQGRHLLRINTPNAGDAIGVVVTDFDTGNTSGFPQLFGSVFSPTIPSPTLTSRPSGAGSGLGTVTLIETSANSRYDALQVQVRGRFASRFQYQASYTFGKATDDVSDVFDLAGASALPQNFFTLAGERGPANFDVRHRFSSNAIYTLPALSNQGRAARAIFGGLEIAGTGQFQTAQPFTVNSIFDVNGDGNFTDRLNSTNGLVQTGNRQQPLQLTSAAATNPTSLLASNFTDGRIGRNTFRTSNLLLVNLAVVKNFAITERQKLTIRTEIFNLTNRANFGIPVRFLEAPGFGQATDTVTPGRRVQFALKYSF